MLICKNYKSCKYMSDNEFTTIGVKPSTKERFEKFGVYGDSADDILNKLMDKAEGNEDG